MSRFTPTQGRYLAFISAYMDAFGQSPAESEIGEALKVSGPSVNQMMKTLVTKGLIQRQVGVPRSIELLIDSHEIPKWTGKRPSRVVWQWVEANPAQTGVKPPVRNRATATVYQFKVVLVGSRPAIWRRIEVLDVTLAKFHEALQTAMGWRNSHLHAFQVGNVSYTDPKMMDDFENPFEKSYARLKISDLIEVYGPKLRLIYVYDFGDGWEHTVTLEKMAEKRAGVQYPRCTAGARHCPPEDVGGIPGYENMLEALQDSQHDEHDDVTEWFGEFDPKAFDLAKTNKSMKVGLPFYY